jgi:hypothetical protein
VLGRACILVALMTTACEFHVAAVSVGGTPGVGGDLGVGGVGGGGGGGSGGGGTGGADLATSGPDLAPTSILMGARGDVPATVDLTAEGTLDWIHFGLLSSTDVDRKAGGPQLFALMPVGGLHQYGAYTPAFTWTDGTPTAMATNHGGIYVNGTGNGFTLSLPAPTDTRTVYLYVTSFGAHATLTAHLSDGSAADYTDMMITGGANVFARYAITVRAASPSVKLVLDWTLTSASGYASVDLLAATIQ